MRSNRYYWEQMAARLASWCDDCSSIVPPGRTCQCHVVTILKGDYRCPVCRSEAGDDALIPCGTCKTVYHVECLRELTRGQCTVLGCETDIVWNDQSANLF
jgi:hypothetical protein